MPRAVVVVAPARSSPIKLAPTARPAQAFLSPEGFAELGGRGGVHGIDEVGKGRTVGLEGVSGRCWAGTGANGAGKGGVGGRGEEEVLCLGILKLRRWFSIFKRLRMAS